MLELAVVTKINKKYAKVRIGRNSACAACGKCGMTQNQKHIDITVENSCNAVVGDTVQVEIPEQNPAGLAFIGYIIPLLPALLLMFLSIYLWQKDWLGIVMFFAGYALGVLIVHLLDKRKKHGWAQAPKMVQIISNNQIIQNKGE